MRAIEITSSSLDPAAVLKIMRTNPEKPRFQSSYFPNAKGRSENRSSSFQSKKQISYTRKNEK